ncbi:murein L,D-transpeptidase [Sphingomonas aracearum]|uniref:Murein L,D-transpeptidase n=2 Tax=Sphingomonas aracearum TaxID=2283317 RepID=A0A369VVH4_9SPHN|nr:L,D-transpeptidase [Sphingomonas aracearum]RDE06083.1 murein L,D-transpeptidase [Sphingomonas aracearum]
MGLLAAPATIAAPAPAIDRNLLQVQVILDHLGFSPGVLDGRPGISLTAALKGFQMSRGLPVTGKTDPATVQALNRYKAWAPTRTLTLTREALAGPYINPIPKNENDQAKLPALAYRSLMEKLAEMFHTTPAVLMALNGPDTRLAPGTKVVFPNALPFSRDYDPKLKPEWRQTLNMLNVSAQQPQAARIVVDKSEKVLRAYDAAGKLVAQFMVTTGSGHDPLPLGTWSIPVVDTNPKFHFNPALFWDASKGDEKAMLPPGPNGPVGVVWIDLSKEHYGIHGTPEPQNIGRTESHGCVRLANWDAARLAQMVTAGKTKVVFQA